MTSEAPPATTTPGAAIFVADASAEAERVARALRGEGYVVVDVPTALLGARVAVQKPALVLLDVDAEGALEILARIREAPGGQSIDVVFVGDAGRTVADVNAALAAGGSGLFTRPVDVQALLRKVKSLAPLEGSARAETGMTPPPGIPSSRARPLSSPPDGGPAAAPSNPPSVRGVGPISAGPPSMLDPIDATGLGVPSQPAPAVGTQLSEELARVLQSAEDRVGQGFRASSQPPSPEEEVDAVLPAELLAALDEPLAFEEEDDGSASGSAVWHGRTPSRGGTGTGASTRHGNDPSPTPPRASAAASSRPPGYDTPTPAPRSPIAHDDSERETPRPPRRGSVSPEPAARLLPPVVEVTPAPAPSDPPETRRPQLRTTRFESSPPTTGNFPMPGRAESEPELRDDLRDEPRAVEAPDDPPLAIEPSSVVFGAGDALQLVAKAVAERHTGCLCFDDGNGLRRVVLRDGDLTTAGSSFEDETLVAFLAARGEVPKDIAKRLGARLPPFGRHAGAALVAHGHLAQDRLWEVLRGHAEWVVGRIVILGAGTCLYEAEPPGRLRAEPSVFGGSTGCEVLVEVVRRVTPPVVAVQRLGGSRARLADGPRRALLGECALTPAEVEIVERARGATIAELIESASAPEIATVLFGLVALGVLEIMSAARGASAAPPPERDPLDEEALRARVRARLDLVEEGDYFAILGVARAATPYEIKRAYLEMRRSFEPGRVLTAATADLAEAVATILEVADEAYDILRDTTRRERYRRAIEG